MSDTTVKVNQLSIGYDKKVICENMSFEIWAGEITCLMGKNGAGKSTFLKTIGGLLPAIHGEVFISGRELKEFKRNELSKVLAVVLTQRISVDFMTAMEITCMGRYPHTGFMGRLTEQDKEIALTSLEQTGAIDLADRMYSTLSDGEKQKVLIARAIAQEPQILLLDEPTTHLDIKHKLEIMDLLNRLARERNMSVILSLHELDLAVKACQHIIAMKDKHIVYDGSPEAMEKDDMINRLFELTPRRFSYVTGSVELWAGPSDKCFVISCCGTGITVYRLLAKNRIGFSTGILCKSDNDYPIALSMGAQIFTDEFSNQDKSTVQQTILECLSKTHMVIDSGFCFNEQTVQNKELLEYAIARNMNIISFRSQDEFLREFGKAHVTFINNISEAEPYFLL